MLEHAAYCNGDEMTKPSDAFKDAEITNFFAPEAASASASAINSEKSAKKLTLIRKNSAGLKETNESGDVLNFFHPETASNVKSKTSKKMFNFKSSSPNEVKGDKKEPTCDDAEALRQRRLNFFDSKEASASEKSQKQFKFKGLTSIARSGDNFANVSKKDPKKFNVKTTKSTGIKDDASPSLSESDSLDMCEAASDLNKFNFKAKRSTVKIEEDSSSDDDIIPDSPSAEVKKKFQFNSQKSNAIKEDKTCPLCEKSFGQDEQRLIEHASNCDGFFREELTAEKCPVCDRVYPPEQLPQHVQVCAQQTFD